MACRIEGASALVADILRAAFDADPRVHLTDTEAPALVTLREADGAVVVTVGGTDVGAVDLRTGTAADVVALVVASAVGRAS